MILGDIIKQFEEKIPLSLQEEWDTGGLQVGSRQAKVSRVLFAYDPCHEVVRHAARQKAQLIVTHHPLRMKPWKNLDLDSYDGKTVEEAIRSGIAIYSAHTSHDSSPHSLNRHYASELGLKNCKPLRPQTETPYVKLAVFVPVAQTKKVMEALFAAGAGHIGDYSSCSFRTEGTGTFKGEEGTNPFLGKPGVLEEAKENRVEVVLDKKDLPQVISAMIAAHPYEEVAYDILPLGNQRNDIGSGIKGELEKSVKLGSLVKKVKEIFEVSSLRLTGDPEKSIRTVALCTGSGTSLLQDVVAQKMDLFITGDVKYHYAVEALRSNVALIDVGHFHSEIKSVTLLRDLFKELFGAKLELIEYKELRDPLVTF
ncbi:MAG: Nif3-like dinuclear metal center hexameric protein [Deltaproteobacteria bacterium]|nr:Nif3-like dinuclear metal center hexameric protein [Deltaproteobacteria bacterium]